MSEQNFDPSKHPHRRYNPLKDEWVLVSPQRNLRPWQGKVEQVVVEVKPKHSADCYLCAGNSRANGLQNPQYSGPWVFDNDFPALLIDTPQSDSSTDNSLLECQSVRGTARVLCFSERHDLSLAQLSAEQIQRVVGTWVEQTKELAENYRYIALFENKGAIMGCSNPHPHGQIWASDFIPKEIVVEDDCQRKYAVQNNGNLLVDYAALEVKRGERIVIENKDWLVVVPYWAIWPFETMVLPRRHRSDITALSSQERSSLADVLKRLTTRYDNLFETEFPYSMGWHGAPQGGEHNSHWQLHAHFYPPLLRSATVRKFMVGYEMLAEAQRDMTAEDAAKRLREIADVHYKQEKT